MSQQKYWEQEYRQPKFLSLSTEPQHEVLRFVQWATKEAGIDVYGQVVLDLGCGNGRNLNYLADQYACGGFGYDISETAIVQARAAADSSWPIVYETRSIGQVMPLEDLSVDLVLDITASPSLYEGERQVYLSEIARVLKPGGHTLVRLLMIDGDRNAKNLIKQFPGPEVNTYIHPDSLIVEHVISEKEAKEFYGQYFNILEVRKHTGYQRWSGKSFKRRYISLYLQKPV